MVLLLFNVGSHLHLVEDYATENDVLLLLQLRQIPSSWSPAGSPSRGGDAAVYGFDINQPSLPAPFYSVLVSISVFMALSTVFHSMNSPDNFPLSHSVLPVLFLPDWFCIYLL